MSFLTNAVYITAMIYTMLIVFGLGTMAGIYIARTYQRIVLVIHRRHNESRSSLEAQTEDEDKLQFTIREAEKATC